MNCLRTVEDNVPKRRRKNPRNSTISAELDLPLPSSLCEKLKNRGVCIERMAPPQRSTVELTRKANNKSNVLNANGKTNVGSGRKPVDQSRRKKYVEKILFRWFKKQSLVAPINRRLLFSKARRLAKALEADNFTPTDGWLTRWKARYNISSNLPGEKSVTKSHSTTSRIETVDLVSDSDHDENEADDDDDSGDDEEYFGWNGEMPLITELTVLNEEEDNQRLVINADGKLVMVEEVEVDKDQESAFSETVVDRDPLPASSAEDFLAADPSPTPSSPECVALKATTAEELVSMNSLPASPSDECVAPSAEESVSPDALTALLPVETVITSNPLPTTSSEEFVAPEALLAATSENMSDQTLPSALDEVRAAFVIIQRTLELCSATADDINMCESLKARIEVLIENK